MKRWSPLLTICLGSLMLLVDVTIVNVALPAMSLDLSATFADLQWVVDVYALLLAATLLAVGTLGDRFGHRRMHLAGLALFGIASLTCGLSSQIPVLIVARAVQGIGAAALFATTFPLINAAYQGRDRGTAYAVWGSVSGAAAALGPVAGGLLTEHLSWEWIFFVNLPVTVVALILGARALPRPAANAGQRLDIAGAATFTVFAAALTYGLIEAGFSGWGGSRVLVSFAVALVSLVWFVLHERRVTHPLLELSLLRNKVFVATLVAGAVVNLSSFAALGFVSIWLQSVQGMSPIGAGLAGGLTMSAVAFVASGVAGRALANRPPVLAIATGLVAIGSGSLVLALQLGGGAGWSQLIAGQVLVGLGVGVAIPVLSSAAMAVVAPQQGGMASGSVNTARQLGFALGLAVLGTVLTSAMTSQLESRGVDRASELSQALAAGQARAVAGSLGGITTADDVFLHALQQVFLGAGILALVAAVLVFFLMRSTRRSAAVVAQIDDALAR